MSRNPADESVTARVIFVGVMLACFNDRGEYEVGMVRCPKHAPKITVLQSDGASASEIPVGDWPDRDLLLKVNNPALNEISIHSLTNQNTSFHRVLDMEGFLLHRGPVIVDPDRLVGRRLAVTAGQLYTHELSEVDFDLLIWTDPGKAGTRVGHIGKVAHKVGVNIQCRDQAGSGIQLLDLKTEDEICAMPAETGKSYEITIENDCSLAPETPSVGTDFRYFYEQGFVRGSDGLKFDLGYEDAVSATTGAPLPSPKACEKAFLSQTRTLGLRN